MRGPRIYLAIDNCFASKRWTRPSEWMEITKSLGLNYIEASTDNECDPLYTNHEYLKDWMKEVNDCAQKTGAKVVNFYSGHGTYYTLGLGHTDKRIRDRILNDWLKPLVQMASRLETGAGFFCHAFSDDTLQNKEEYFKAEEELYERLANLTKYAYDNNVNSLSVEQMYSPHQIPWTVSGTKKLLKEVCKRSKCPFYITIDTGHQTGQRKFLLPSYGKITEEIRRAKKGEEVAGLWLGSRRAYILFDRAVKASDCELDGIVKEIEAEMNRYPYLFAEYNDGDPYYWLEKLACYSPIIHLQQTNGKSSSHFPFTNEFNQDGVIYADKVLNAIKASYDAEIEEGMPPRCDKIYLTFEIFSPTADINVDIIKRLKDTVLYWRRFVPEDGLFLNELVK